MSASLLTSLPTDLLKVELIRHLPLNSLPALFRTNRLFHHLSHDPYLWHLLIQRDFNRPYSGKNTQQVYRVLRQAKQKYSSLSYPAFNEEAVERIFKFEEILDPYLLFLNSLLPFHFISYNYFELNHSYKLNSYLTLHLIYLWDINIILQIRTKYSMTPLADLSFNRQRDPTMIQVGIKKIIEGYQGIEITKMEISKALSFDPSDPTVTLLRKPFDWMIDHLKLGDPGLIIKSIGDKLIDYRNLGGPEWLDILYVDINN